MKEHELKFLLDGKSIVYVPIYSMFDHQSGLVDLECDGNVNRWMTNLYKSGQTWKKMVIFGPSRDLAKSEESFMSFKSKLERNFSSFEYVESRAFSGGAKKQRSSAFPAEIFPDVLDRLLECDVAIVESQELFRAFLAAKTSGQWDGKLVYWCPVCATSKTRSFLEESRDADLDCFRCSDHIIVATEEQATYLKMNMIPISRITVAREFIDRELPMFKSYDVDSEALKEVEDAIKSGKLCIYLPFRLSDEGYKIWEILEVIYTRLVNGDLEAFVPNLNGSSSQELVKLCKSHGCQLSDDQITLAISKFKPISARRSTYYTLIDYCSDLVIPYFEDWKFIMHAAVDELILGNIKPKCTVVQSRSELEVLLNNRRRVVNSLKTMIEKKMKMDRIFDKIVESKSFKKVVERYGTTEKIPSFVFSGVGKNWYICEKVVKTFISLGIQAQALDCIHALHGDLGMLKAEGPKVLVFVSRSGTTVELVKLAKIVKKLKELGILKDLETVALFLNKTKPNAELYDIWITPDDLEDLNDICEFDERNLVPSISINIIQMVLDLLGVLIYEGKPDLIAGYVYSHLAGGNGEKLGGDAILKAIN